MTNLEHIAIGFIAEVEAADRVLEQRGAGGQQIPFHGDFASVTPSAMGRLRWWANAMKVELKP